jgi:hypothetical protein
VISCVKRQKFSKSIFENFWHFWRTKILTKPCYLWKDWHLGQNRVILGKKVIRSVKWIFLPNFYFWGLLAILKDLNPYQTSLFEEKLTCRPKLGHFESKSDQLWKFDKNSKNRFFRTFGDFDGLKSTPNLVFLRKDWHLGPNRAVLGQKVINYIKWQSFS